MKTKTILVRREQTKNIADAIAIKMKKNAKIARAVSVTISST